MGNNNGRHSHKELTNRSIQSDDTISDLSVVRTRRSTHSLHSYKGHQKRASLLMISNGVTGKYISSRICKIAATFWKNNIDTLPISDQLEIGASIFFTMISANNEMKKIMNSNLKSTTASEHTIESTSIKYLDMMGWLIRHLVTDGINFHALLSKLGAFHQQMGIKIHHFTPMLAAMHDTFAYYFEAKYNIEVKYAIDEIFSFTAQILTGQNLNCSSHLMNITKQFDGKKIPFLNNLQSCLESSIGTQYLNRYLAQTWCDEIVIFLKSLHRFKHLMTDKERFFVAREIVKHSIDPKATFALNLSCGTRNETLYAMVQLEDRFAANQPLTVPSAFFDAVEQSTHKLIAQNHWIKFVKQMESLQSKSFE